MDGSKPGAAVDYGAEEAAMQAYLREGEQRAFALGNRGPIRFTASGELHPDIVEAYWRCGFYVFEGVLEPDELADIERDVKDILDRLPVEKGAPLDAKGRPALAADCQAPTLLWSKPLGDPFGGTDLANGRHPVKMYEPKAAAERLRRHPRITRHQAIEVVEHVEQARDEGGLSPVAELDALARDALLVVVELGGEPEMPVAHLLELAFDPGGTALAKDRLRILFPRRRALGHIGGGEVRTVGAGPRIGGGFGHAAGGVQRFGRGPGNALIVFHLRALSGVGPGKDN